MSGHRGEREISRKPLRREGRAAPASPVVPAPCIFFARGPWVWRTPGLPCALLFIEGHAKLGHNASREYGGVSPRHCERRQCVGWAKRLVRRSSKSVGGSVPTIGTAIAERRWARRVAPLPTLRTAFLLWLFEIRISKLRGAEITGQLAIQAQQRHARATTASWRGNVWVGQHRRQRMRINGFRARASRAPK
jgi:hypothetical protein